MRGATAGGGGVGAFGSFQSTRPMRGATDGTRSSERIRERFNPRAPCGARPRVLRAEVVQHKFQSTRPMRGATVTGKGQVYFVEFQSTRPMRGATWTNLSKSPRPPCFNPRAPCGARPVLFQTFQIIDNVSIHAPHAGRDGKRGHDFPPLPRIYGYSPPQIRFSRHLRPAPLLRHDSRTYIFIFCFLFTSPSHSVMNAQMMIAASKS